MLEIWKNVLVSPKKTFKKEKRKASLEEALKHVLIAAIISGVITGLASFNAIIFVITLVLTPILAIIVLLIGSGINYVFARLLGGKGTYTTQTHLMALYIAPLSIIMAILSVIPVIGGWLNLLTFLYTLYLLTLSLKEAHSYSTGRAVLTWLMPLIITAVILVMLVASILAYFGIFAPTDFIGPTT